MKTSEEYNEIYFRDDNLDLTQLIEEIQKEAWNEVIEDLINKIDYRRAVISQTIDYFDVADFELQWIEKYLKRLKK